MDVPALDPAMVRDLDPTCCHDEVLGTLERLARSIDASIDTDAPVTTMIPLAVNLMLAEHLEDQAASL